jgi:potassium-transporting ATPase KdpC subunit
MSGKIDMNTFSPALRVVILMLVLTGIAYPVFLAVVGQSIFPFQSNGSVVEFNGKRIGSSLIAQNFESPKFFHPRALGESASGVDPHITPESAFSQIQRISDATMIPENHLRTLVELNIERNKIANILIFAPQYVNVLEMNVELVKQYPEVYSEFMEP